MFARLLGSLAISVFLASAAFGADRGIDFTQQLLDENGKVVKDGDGKPATLGETVSHALFAAFADEKLSGEESFARGSLAMRIKSNADAKLTAEEIALIKRVVAKAYNPLIVYRVWPIVDPAVAAK